VVAVAVLAAVAIMVTRPHNAARATTTPTASGSPSAHPPGIDSVATDPRPITPAEIFPRGRVSAEGHAFTRLMTADSACSAAARGSFARALTAAGCERVVRATYIDTRKRFAITMGIAALPNLAVAQSADQHKNLGHNVWFVGLAGQAGSGGQHVNTSGGYAYDLIDGRYIIFALATYSDGHMPTGTGVEDSALNAIGRDFAMMTKKPIIQRAG
jgi:hypothetical protein